ncbi:MAG: hypothetical protein E7629_04075 [Ruminococcaceae bacterium]|nr:hypothetical protein [Oscillospiraceae bacterium]
MEKQLYSKFKEKAKVSLCLTVSLIFIATLFLTFSLLAYFNVIVLFGNSGKDMEWTLILALMIELVAIVTVLEILIPYFLDYRSIKNGTYPTYNVVVSRFDFYESGSDSIEKIWFPVFEDVNSGKTLKMETDEKVEIGERYTILYLPRTKIKVLKKQ